MATTVPARMQGRSGSQTAPQLFRVGGSGFTAFHWQGQIIGFAQAVGHTSPQPVAQPVAIQPLDQRYPLQIITPAAVGVGTLTLQMYEMYNQKIWDQIMKITDATSKDGGVQTNRLATYNDLVEVFIRLANIGKGINCTKIIYPPNKVQVNKTQYYADTYHNCVITDIRDDENVSIGMMEVIKSMTIQYTNVTRNSASA